MNNYKLVFPEELDIPEVTLNLETKTVVGGSRPTHLSGAKPNDIFTFKGKQKQWKVESIYLHVNSGITAQGEFHYLLIDKAGKSKSRKVQTSGYRQLSGKEINDINPPINYIGHSTVFTDEEVEAALNTGYVEKEKYYRLDQFSGAVFTPFIPTISIIP